MAISYDKILASTPFKFLVGPNKRVFTVHSALVAHLSSPLNVLVNGSMSEAKEGCATLQDIDEATFVRFSQYAYTGDYAAADPEILLDSSAIDTGQVPSVTTDRNLESPKKKQKQRATAEESDSRGKYCPECRNFVVAMPAAPASSAKKSESWNRFQNRTYASSRVSFQPRKNRESCEDYTEVFLGHARLYVFADQYDIGPLRELSLYKLQRTLTEFTLYDERVGDVVALMRYTYLNTFERSESAGDLRLLVGQYAACNVEDLSQSVVFRSLLGEDGSMAGDLLTQVLERVD